MKINIICIGKIKEKYFIDAINEYSKRLSKFIKLEIIELQDEKIPDNASKSQLENIKNIEGDKILKKIKNNSFIISLDLNGQSFSSEDFALYFKKQMVNGFSDITFIIGGSLGICESVLNASNFKISFSKMTFTHQMMRVILLEQIYRAFKINFNEPYHK